jgi:hypothetical protein
MWSKLSSRLLGALASLLVLSAFLGAPLAVGLNWLGFTTAATYIEIVLVAVVVLAGIFKKQVFGKK